MILNFSDNEYYYIENCIYLIAFAMNLGNISIIEAKYL
jgi:hypothetical protein